jgi:lysophospholipase L1-like esterase
MTRLHSLDTVAKDYEKLIESLPKHKTLIVMSCGNLGGAKIFPSIIGRLYERISRRYHAKFAEIVTRYGGVYIEIFDERSVDPFIREPEVYLAADLFHPSSTGYKYWFTKVEAKL